MAQLSDDCFAFGGKLLSIDAALRIIAADVRRVEGVEQVALHAADGRVLAERRVRARRPAALRQLGGGWLRRAPRRPGARAGAAVAGRLAAGAPAADALAPGTTRRIFTGAALPAGVDTVFMQEDVRLDEQGRVRFPPA